MKMRKLMAVLLAVVVAISAMAISVFADETYTIPMYNYSSTSENTTTYTISIPAYYFYGYLNYGNTLTLNLPTNFTAPQTTADGTQVAFYNNSTMAIVLKDAGTTVDDINTDTATYTEIGTVESIYTYDSNNGVYVVPTYNLGVSYTLTVNGVKVALKGSDDTCYVDTTTYGYSNGDSTLYSTYYQTVDIGYFALDWYHSWTNGEIYRNAMIPQSTSVSASDTVTLTATVDWSCVGSDVTTANWNLLKNWWPAYYAEAYGDTTYISVNDSTGAVVSTAYGVSMSVSKSTDTTSSQNNVVIIADTTADSADFSETSTENTLLYWDHTLYNRNIMLLAASTEGATATLEVKLADSIYGYAVYTLTTSAEAVATSDVYSYSNGLQTDLWYGTGTSGLYNAVADTYTMSGETTDTLTFNVPVSALYNSSYGVYNGTMFITQLLTATSADASVLSTKYYTNSDTYALEATEVNLIVTIPTDDDDTVVENEEPVEDTNSETEDDELTVDDTEPVEETETNPTTGIVLALVPMAVAAAAAVASKRR